MKQKKWYHATNKKALRNIKKSGVLWGGNDIFLARNAKELESMVLDSNRWNADMHKNNEVILSVRYVPNNIDDDYDPCSWEMRVTKPISIDNVRLLKYL